MKKAKKIIIWLVIVLGVVGVVVWRLNSNKPTTIYTTADAAKGRLAQTVSVTGDLVAETEITLNFEIGGRVNQVFVKPSDQVMAGDKIATLTDADLQRQVEQAKAALDEVIGEAGTNHDELREAKVERENAENTLEATKELADENTNQAEELVDSAERYLLDAKALYESSSTFANKLTLTEAQNRLDTAKQTLKVEDQKADLEKTLAENNLATAEAKVKTAESKFAKQSRDARVDQARAGYELALNNFAKATLISPVNGIITEVNNKQGEILGTGVIKESFSRVMSLDTLIESQVPESDIIKLKLGQKARVTFDAFDGSEEFVAEIIEIDPASTTIQDVVYYEIKLKLINTDARIKRGMSANIDIAAAEKNDVVMIPQRAIKTEDKKKYVEVLEAENTVRKIYVETGLEGDDGMVEIKSGLSGGEKVVTFAQTK